MIKPSAIACYRHAIKRILVNDGQLDQGLRMRFQQWQAGQKMPLALLADEAVGL